MDGQSIVNVVAQYNFRALLFSLILHNSDPAGRDNVPLSGDLLCSAQLQSS
jgi:hypothetical protein